MRRCSRRWKRPSPEPMRRMARPRIPSRSSCAPAFSAAPQTTARSASSGSARTGRRLSCNASFSRTLPR
eukprot:9186738-Alexandrium_andersonii.AAC.1